MNLDYMIPTKPDALLEVNYHRRWSGGIETREVNLRVKGEHLDEIVEKLEQQGYNPMNLSQEDLIVLEMLDKQNIEIYNLLYNRAQQDLK